MLTVLTQTPPFISSNRACEPGFTGIGALATFPSLPGRNDFVFVPALVLAGAPIGALPTSCRRLLGEGSAKTVLSKLLKEIADRAAGAAWSSATYPIAARSWWSLPAAKSLMYALGTMDLRRLRLGRSSKCGDASV